MDRKFITPLIVASALFMENVDSTVIATSLEAIAHDLRQDPLALKLTLTSYLVSEAVFIPASAWIADKFGARRIFCLALAIFVFGSILCGMAGSLTAFVIARVIQGFGGAMMMPVGRLLVIRSVPRSEMIAAFAYLTVPAMIGPIIGPPLGGFITTYLHWRWIFWINVPIGLTGALLAMLFIKDVREDDPGRLDIPGFLLTGIAFSCSIFGFTTIGGGFLPLWQSLSLVGVGVASFLAYLAYARRITAPIIDLSLLRVPTFRYALTGSLIFRVSVGAVPFLLPLMLQVGFGLSAIASGSLTFASACGSMVMKAAAPAMLRKFGFRTALIGCGVLAAVMMGANGLFTPQTSHAVIFLVLLAAGFFRSLQFTALNGLAFCDLKDSQMSKGTSLTAALQQFSTALGVALGASIVELTLWLRGGEGVAADSFAIAFYAVALCAGSSALVFVPMSRDAGAHVARSGRRTRGAQPAAADAPAGVNRQAAE